MAHKHAHTKPGELNDAWVDRKAERRVHRYVLAFLIPLTILGIFNISRTWPDEVAKFDFSSLGYIEQTAFYSAQVRTIENFDCIANGATQLPDGTFSTSLCAKVSAELLDGPNKGENVFFEANASIVQFGIQYGDNVSLAAIPTETETIYVFNDFERTNGLIYLFALVVIVLIAISGFSAIRALLGLLVTFGLLATYLIPSLILGANVIFVLISVLAAITGIVLYLVHGFSLKTAAAILGTLSGSVIALISAVIVSERLSLTGITGDDDLVLSGVAPDVRLSNLLIASIVVAGIGALNDVTVTQSSAVWELASAQNKPSWYALFKGGMRVGRDHIASSVYTIAFAYVGSALVTLMLLFAANPPLDRLINDEVVAQELTLIMVGAIALALSTPITTALAALFAKRIRNPRYQMPLFDESDKNE